MPSRSLCACTQRRGLDRYSGKRVLVLGAEPIGTILALIARSAGAGFVAVGDRIDEPLRRTADLGVDETINVATEADRLAGHAEGKGTFDIVFEASGSAEATISALDVVKPRGTIVCVGHGRTARDQHVNDRDQGDQRDRRLPLR